MNDNSNLSTFVVSARIDAPAIQTQQDEFLAENPGVKIVTVADYNDRIAKWCIEAVGQLEPGAAEGHGSFSSEISYITDDDIEVNMFVQGYDLVGAARKGAEMTSGLTAMLEEIIYALLNDPLGEHRRRDIEDIISFERELRGSELDEAARREELYGLPLERLCMMNVRNRSPLGVLVELMFDDPSQDSQLNGPKGPFEWLMSRIGQ